MSERTVTVPARSLAGLLLTLGAAIGCSYDYTIEPGAGGATSSSASSTPTTTASTGTGGAASTTGGEASSSGGGSSTSASSQGGAGQGGAGGSGGEGGGAPECETVDTCPAPEDECLEALCEGGVCGVVPVDAGTPLEVQPPGDCRTATCDGRGGVTSEDADDPPSSTECASFTCAGGEVVPDFEDAGTPCGAVGLECDGAGSCIGCNQPSDCGTDTECSTPTCDEGTGVCGAILERFGFALSDPSSNCTRRVCDGQGAAVSMNDPSDPVSDGNACTTDGCSNMAPQYTALGAGSTPAGCNGTCQGSPFAGQCGLRVYSRPFPQAGAWTFVPMSQTFAGNVPLGNILAAEMNSAGTRLIVWHGNGNVYERIAGTWQAGVASTVRFPNVPSGTSIASAVMANFGNGADVLVLTTNEAQPRSLSYDVAPTGAPVLVGGPTVIPPDPPPNQPPQDTVPIAWAFGEQRYDLSGAEPLADDQVVFWKGLQGTVYELWYPTFSYQTPFPEATSLLQMNGAGNDAPASGTAVAAYYDRPATTVYIVAP